MKPVVTASQMAELDRKCIQETGIPGVVLMENAGAGIFRAACSITGGPRGKTVVIFCGPGNNGGDGYVVARYLLNAGAKVTTIVLAPREKIKGDAKCNLEILQKMGHRPRFIKSADDLPHIRADLVVDALLGTGVEGALRGVFADTVLKINSSHVPVLSVDIPTGIHADTGAVAGPVVRARQTATMALKKQGMVLPPGQHYCGEIKVIDIGTPDFLITGALLQVFEIESADIRNMLPSRAPDAHKNSCGTAAVIAGSRGFSGAAVLTAKAVLRTGAGLGYLFVPNSLNDPLEAQLTEIITRPQDDAKAGYLHSGCYDELCQDLSNVDVIAMGPGLGRHHETALLVRKLLKTMEKPLVLDADGLNLCIDHTELFRNYKNSLVLTPHPGELSRLTGLTATEILADRINVAQKYASEWQVTLVLKGGPTIIALKDGRVMINSTGNAGMATAGSGDVLTGMIAALLAQGLKAEDAATAGVYLHGLAGDLAREEKDEMGMIAGDILHWIPHAIKAEKNA